MKITSLFLLVFVLFSALARGPQGLTAGEAVPDLRTRKTGSDWPRFLGLNGDGKSSETGILKSWPDSGPPLVWQCEIGEGYSMPAIALGRLFMFDRVENQARLTCLHSETGQRLWQVSYPTDYEDMYRFSGGPRTTPVVDGDRVYIFGVEGRLRCHRVTDGALLWEIDTAREFAVMQNFFGVGASPVIEGDLLIAQIGGSPPDSPSIQSGKVVGNGSGIVAFDKISGHIRYQMTDELASYATPRFGEIHGKRLGLVFARGGLVGFHPRAGKVAFHFPWRAKKLESVNASTPVVVGDTVFITESYGPGGALLKIHPDRAEIIWKDPRRDQRMACHWSTPIYHQGYLYGCSGMSGGDAKLRCIDYRTGKIQWSQPGLRRTNLLYADGHFVVLGEYGELSLVEATPKNYRLVAQAKLLAPPTSHAPPSGEKAEPKPLLKYPAWNTPILAHGLLYLRGKDRLACLELIPRYQ